MKIDKKELLINYGQLLEYAKISRRQIDVKTCVKYGIRILDEYLGGVLPSELVVIGADPGLGKSDIAYNLSITNALRGKKVLLLALEGDIEEIALRHIQQEMNKLEIVKTIDYRFNLNSELMQIEDDAINNIFGKVKENLFVYNKKEICDLKFTNELIVGLKDDFDLIVIDHLHYIHFEGENENRAFGEIMRTLKTTTDIIKKPIILMSHLRKRDTTKDPTMYDLYGSSNVSKEATSIILLSRLEKNNFENILGLKESMVNDSRYSGTKIMLKKSRIGVPYSNFELIYDRFGKKYLDDKQWLIEKESGAKIDEKIMF